MRPCLLRHYLWLLPLLLLAGYTRLDELAWHFPHVDDLLVAERIQDMYAQKANETGVLAALDAYDEAGYRVFASSTYAPFGGYMSALWVRTYHDYRQTLFWGRLPNALAGILLVLATALLARWLFPSLGMWGGWLAGGWMLLAWEHIIYSQQMTPYVYAQLAGLLVLALALWYAALSQPGKWAQLWLWLGFALAFHMTYQAVVLLPAFVWVSYRGHPHTLLTRQNLTRFIPALLLFLAAISPLVKRLLNSDLLDKGVNKWNAGLHQEFVFDWTKATADGWYALKFWGLNTWHVVQGLLGSSTPGSAMAAVQAGVLLVCVALGIWHLATSKQAPLHRRLITWVGLVALAWVGFVLAGKFSYSPTRHSLLLSPILVLLATAGAARLAKWLGQRHLPNGLACLLLVPHAWGFVAGYAQERAQRRDVLAVDTLQKLVETYAPQTIYTYYWSQQPTYLQALSAQYRVRNEHFVRVEALPRHQPATPGRRPHYLFYSHRTPLDEAAWQYAIQAVGAQTLPGQLSDYQVVYTYAHSTQAEVEFSPLTQNGHNGCYITVICPR